MRAAKLSEAEQRATRRGGIEESLRGERDRFERAPMRLYVSPSLKERLEAMDKAAGVEKFWRVWEPES